MPIETLRPPAPAWLRLPGLFYRFELEQLLDLSGRTAYRFEMSPDVDGRRALIAVYHRPLTADEVP